MVIENKLNNATESFDKYHKNLLNISRKIIENIIESNQNIIRIEESIFNEIFFPDKLTTIDRNLSIKDIFFINLFYGFNEIYISFERLKDLEIYMSHFPNIKNPDAKINYFHFLIENHLNEIYILKERLNKYLKKISKSYMEDRRCVSILKTCDQLIDTIEDNLKNVITTRGIHIHSVRYLDRDIKRLESLFLYKELLYALQKHLPDFIVPNFKNEYRKLRRKWKKIFKNNNEQIKLLLDCCFKKMFEIVFTNDGEISYPEKRNYIENRKKFFSKG